MGYANAFDGHVWMQALDSMTRGMSTVIVIRVLMWCECMKRVLPVFSIFLKYLFCFREINILQCGECI